MAPQHIPVLLDEAMHWLDVRQDGCYVDATVGSGGHSREILRRLEGTGLLIGLDRDRDALVQAQKRLSPSRNLRLVHEDFRNLPTLLPTLGLERVDGLLLDLGVSSLQLDTPSRGFSFRLSGPLDMRMDTRQHLTAAQLLNSAPEKELARIFREYGEAPAARRLARAVAETRRQRPLASTEDLAELADRTIGNRRGKRIHPATQIFQAVRIAVNGELEGIERLLGSVAGLLTEGGRLVAISFHSLEDRLVKRTLQKGSGRCICRRPGPLCTCPRIEYFTVLTRKPITASGSEAARNPRARSAKLRAAERTAQPLENSRHNQRGRTRLPNTTRLRRLSSFVERRPFGARSAFDSELRAFAGTQDRFGIRQSASQADAYGRSSRK